MHSQAKQTSHVENYFWVALNKVVDCFHRSILKIWARTGTPRQVRAVGSSNEGRIAHHVGPVSYREPVPQGLVMGQSLPKWAVSAMSGLPPLATELLTSLIVRSVPETEKLKASKCYRCSSDNGHW